MKRKGFTLIELVVVIALIAILAVTLAPRLRDQISKAADAKAIAVLGSLRTQSEIYFADNQETASADGVTIENFVADLDNSAQALFDERGAADEVPIGGSRVGENGDLVYGGQIGYSYTKPSGAFGTADGIQIWFDGVSSQGNTYTHDTKKTAWASY